MLIECVICYENLHANGAIYHTPCGHVFHHACLTRWFKRSKTCPECREKVPDEKISRLYLNFVSSNRTSTESIGTSFASMVLQTQIAALNHELLIKELEIIESNSNNSKLLALLESKESKIRRLQASLLMTVEDKNLCKFSLEEQKKEVDALKNDITLVTKERDDLLSSNRSWDKISQMFHGITEHEVLINLISSSMRELANCTSKQWGLQRTVAELQQKLTEQSERTKKSAAPDIREMQSNLASMEIQKLSLQRRIEELEDMVESGVKPENFVRQKTLEDLSFAAYNSVPFKKRKVETIDMVISGTAGGPATPIDVIDLTVEPVRPLIDLTKDTAETPVSPSATC